MAESPCCSGLPAGGNSGIMARSTRHVSPLAPAHYARRPCPAQHRRCTGTRTRPAAAQPAGRRQGRPAGKPNTPPPPPKDLSSEQERRTPQAWSKGRKTDRIPIDREQVVAVEP